MSSPPSLPIYLFTFNCARLLITPSILATHLFSALDPSSPPPEIIAIGLQEFAPISYSFLRGDYLSPYLDQWSSVPHLAAQYLHSTGTTNQDIPFEYVELGRYTIGMTALFIYARRSERVKNLRFGSVGFGVWGMANKGAVAARFGYSTGDGGEEEEGDINVTIVSTHLSAHEHCCTDRNRDWETLARGIIFETTTQTAPVINITSSESTPLLSENITTTTTGSSSSPISGIYHPNSHLLVMGDLNYRTSHISPTPEDFQSFPTRTDHFNEFFKRDQLTRELTAGNTLHGLVEAPITFPPTYKYLEDVLSLLEDAEEGLGGGGSSSSSTRGDKRRKQSQEDIFDWSPNRWPSWCDRILWLPLNPSSPSPPKEEEEGKNDIKVHRYTSIPAIRFSDHKPVGLHISLPRINMPKTVAGSEGGNNNRDLRLNPPFPLDRDWKVKRYNAETREWIVGYAILMATTANGLTILGCVFVGAGMLWWGVTGRV
ncbi:hypothetical protein TWF192_007967 [Orbilia oligospora]|uniref:Inositol polyphosphate-related phosphatase domain-containing protein n=1 Tax=Orbilia oligospora TaxID=2813651 RepID=A0A6G1M2U2_ORBOL|nr:hypothetical protein TWF191_009115 [Orbilia oligospora]KAF3243579.1 hypothetical protein TWF192_007967 [Orbilia oligospora]